MDEQLPSTNKEVDTINDIMEGQFPGTGTKLTSSDTLEDYRDVMRFNVEFINTICPNGFPQNIIVQNGYHAFL